MQLQRTHKGFTLIEMMVALAIVTIMATVVTVSSAHWQTHRQHQFSKDRLLLELNYYRSLALSERLSYKCQTKQTTIRCQRFIFNRDGSLSWHDKTSKHILDHGLHMILRQSSPEKNHAIYFLSSGEIPPFLLEVWDAKKLIYRLKSSGTDVVEASEGT